jgi:hypothetical protein
MINPARSFQLWTCNNCNSKWRDMWSSFGQPIWSFQYQHGRYQRQEQEQELESIPETYQL